MLNEWSTFYENASGLNENLKNTKNVFDNVRYDFLCQIFEILILNMTKRTEPSLELLSKFFNLNFQKIKAATVVPLIELDDFA